MKSIIRKVDLIEEYKNYGILDSVIESMLKNNVDYRVLSEVLNNEETMLKISAPVFREAAFYVVENNMKRAYKSIDEINAL